MAFFVQPTKAIVLRLLMFFLILQFVQGLFRSVSLPGIPDTPSAAVDVPIQQEIPSAMPDSPATFPAVDTAPEVAETPVNILLIGQDRQEGGDRTRSDTIILCTFHESQNCLVMTSFLRDLYVEIPGYGKDRINAAYVYGGMPLLNQTLADNFGITVDGNLEVDFAGFTEIIDALGGVTLELRQDEADVINQSTSRVLTEGTHLLTGAEALAYARIRKLDSDGDFSRTARQRKLLESLLKTCKNSNFPTLLSLVKQLLPMVNSDIPKKELLSLALDVLPDLSGLQIRGQHIPQDGTYSYQTIGGMSVLVPDLSAARKFLEETACIPTPRVSDIDKQNSRK